MTGMSHQDLTGSSTHVLEVGAFLKIESLLGSLAQIVACPHQQMLSKILSSKRSCWNFHDIWDLNAKNWFFWGHYLCNKSVFSIPAIKSSVFRGLKTKDWGLQPIPTTSDSTLTSHLKTVLTKGPKKNWCSALTDDIVSVVAGWKKVANYPRCKTAGEWKSSIRVCSWQTPGQGCLTFCSHLITIMSEWYSLMMVIKWEQNVRHSLNMQAQNLTERDHPEKIFVWSANTM